MPGPIDAVTSFIGWPPEGWPSIHQGSLNGRTLQQQMPTQPLQRLISDTTTVLRDMSGRLAQYFSASPRVGLDNEVREKRLLDGRLRECLDTHTFECNRDKFVDRFIAAAQELSHAERQYRNMEWGQHSETMKEARLDLPRYKEDIEDFLLDPLKLVNKDYPDPAEQVACYRRAQDQFNCLVSCPISFDSYDECCSLRVLLYRGWFLHFLSIETAWRRRRYVRR